MKSRSLRPSEMPADDGAVYHRTVSHDDAVAYGGDSVPLPDTVLWTAPPTPLKDILVMLDLAIARHGGAMTLEQAKTIRDSIAFELSK